METNNWAVDQGKETRAEFQGSGKSPGFEKAKQIIADKLHTVAGAMGEKAAAQGAPSSLAQYGKQASEWLDQSAEYVRQFDYAKADARVREYVKQSPGRSLLVAGAVGLIIGAIWRRR
jgi:ElaB/YqjD/DUF883 family membrane-anchored ribosome-binding protein